jgi:hypothetical protein
MMAIQLGRILIIRAMRTWSLSKDRKIIREETVNFLLRIKRPRI